MDVGCGRGEYSLWISRLPGVNRVVGLDEMDGDQAGEFLDLPVAVAKKVVLIPARFDRRVVRDYTPFDLILCVDVLEHILDDSGFLADIAECASRDALLILHVPARPQWHPVASARRELERQLLPGVGQHVREGYSAEEIHALLAKAGWIAHSVKATFGWAGALVCDVDYSLSLKGLRWLLVRAVLAPLSLLASLYEMKCGTERGNGWLVVSRRSAMTSCGATATTKRAPDA